MAAIRHVCKYMYITGGLVTRYISSAIFTPPLSRKVSSSKSVTRQEIFRRALEGLGPQDIDIDPRDRPRSTVIAEINKLPIIHIKVTANNTMLTITDHNGSTLGWTSAGSEGFKNARRGTTFAAQSAGKAAGLKAIGLGIERVKVKLKGIGQSRQHSLKGLEAAGIDIAVLQDVTPIPHNGCKPKKARRL